MFVGQECFDYLDTPIMRIAAKGLPITFRPSLEKAVLSQTEDIIKGAKELFGN